MVKKLIKRTAMYILIVITGYVAIGYLLHLVVFPESKPAVSNYFKPGQQFYSKAEGFKQTIVKQENEHVYCSLEIDPFADGPPKHIHTSFDETFQVHNGTLSVWVDGKVVRVQPGDTLFVPRGTPHKPFNETADTIRVKGEVAFPEKFAYHLPQVYGVMDNTPGIAASPKAILQMSLFWSEGFDSYVADGPPIQVQKTIGFMLTPITRLMGYKSYYKEYDIENINKVAATRPVSQKL
jgi:mannose-6-phosphate isomerase-like protein (cupin superfamily)